MKIGIVGATGLVGRKIAEIMEQYGIDGSEMTFFASEGSAGKTISYKGREYQIEKLTSKSMEVKYDYLLFSAGKEVSLKYAPIAEKSGSVIIDNSSAFRSSRPLIVPEINGHLLKTYKGIVANPNCSTIQLVLAIAPLDKLYGLKKLVVSTYQSVSGAGYQGIETLSRQRKNAENSSSGNGGEGIDLNIQPFIGKIDEAGHCEEELKMQYEIGRILDNKEMQIAVTTVRVPVIYGHSESVYAELEKEISLDKIAELWQDKDYLVYNNDSGITPVEVTGSDKSYVCRLRRGADPKSILFWNVADNIRVGAATNAVKIMNLMIAEGKQH